MGTFNQIASFPGSCNDNNPGSYDPSIYILEFATHSARLMLNLELPAETTVASCRIVIAMRNLRIKNFKPTYTNCFGSGEQLTAQSPLNQVYNLQKRDASLSWRVWAGAIREKLTAS